MKYRLPSSPSLKPWLQWFRQFAACFRASTLGTVAQWATAGAAVTTAIVAFVGLQKAQPLLENAQLREERAELQIAVRNLRTAAATLKAEADNRAADLAAVSAEFQRQERLAWLYVCRQFSTKASSAVTGLSFFSLSGYKYTVTDMPRPLSPLDAPQSWFLKEIFPQPSQSSKTGQDILRNTSLRDELELLSHTRRTQFSALVEQTIAKSGVALTHLLTFQWRAEMTKADVTAESERLDKAISVFRTVVEELRGQCIAEVDQHLQRERL